MDSKFIPFKQSVAKIVLPEKFTFPFYYDPHPLAEMAAEELKIYLQNQTEWQHNFGLEDYQEGAVNGKMFGVLVVQKKSGELGYLAAFSGKLADKNHWSNFVPPVYDLLAENGFFNHEIQAVNALNLAHKNLSSSPVYEELKFALSAVESAAKEALQKLKQEQAIAKKIRHEKRAHLTCPIELEVLRNESIQASIVWQKTRALWQGRVEEAQGKLQSFQRELQQLEAQRKQVSHQLQKKIFEQYTFLNKDLELKSLYAIFDEHNKLLPPAGAGECAAPKLLQYCFKKQWKPICMAEFWWGASPGTEIRKHGQFYPACTGKCEPILKHMLAGMTIDDNPLLQSFPVDEIPIVYEDEYLVAINKPSGLLSVPGKYGQPSVYSYFKAKYPDWSGPIIVHRLDQATSGIMLLAKSIRVYHALQRQFIKRKVEKRYVAILNRVIEEEKGEIRLPLRVDLDDRPRQMVCYEHGKNALTHFEVIERTVDQTRVYFYPHTGRTHQLRVHASHIKGLNAPIVGDDLYGLKGGRLLLHANQLGFIHPITAKWIVITCPAAF